MKHLLILLCFLVSFPTFAQKMYNDGDFERNEIRKARDRGDTKDYGGYWARPTPQVDYDGHRNRVDSHRRALESAIEADRRIEFNY